MKKLVLVFLAVVFVSASGFCQNISDYFPITTGNSWTYTNGIGKSTEIITVKSNTPDTVSKDGTRLYLFESQYQATINTSVMYSIKGNKNKEAQEIFENIMRKIAKKECLPIEFLFNQMTEMILKYYSKEYTESAISKI